jgi:hypothetical protein
MTSKKESGLLDLEPKKDRTAVAAYVLHPRAVGALFGKDPQDEASRRLFVLCMLAIRAGALDEVWPALASDRLDKGHRCYLAALAMEKAAELGEVTKDLGDVIMELLGGKKPPRAMNKIPPNDRMAAWDDVRADPEISERALSRKYGFSRIIAKKIKAEALVATTS